MSSSGFDSGVTSQQRLRGFSKAGVSQFRLMGQTLSSGSLGLQTPKTEERIITREDGRTVRDVGFKGSFAREGQQDIDALLETFQSRRKFILGKKRAPGRSGLLLANR